MCTCGTFVCLCVLRYRVCVVCVCVCVCVVCVSVDAWLQYTSSHTKHHTTHKSTVSLHTCANLQSAAYLQLIQPILHCLLILSLQKVGGVRCNYLEHPPATVFSINTQLSTTNVYLSAANRTRRAHTWNDCSSMPKDKSGTHSM